jgi:hypothetical protein
VEFAQAKGGMATMPRHAAQRLLAFDQHDFLDAKLGQPLRRRKTRGPPPRMAT